MELPLIKPNFVELSKTLYPIYVDGSYSDDNENKRKAYCEASEALWTSHVLPLEEEINVFREYVEVDIEMYQFRLRERDAAESKVESLEKSIKFLNEQLTEISKINNGHVALLEKRDKQIESLEEEKKGFNEREKFSNN